MCMNIMVLRRQSSIAGQNTSLVMAFSTVIFHCGSLLPLLRFVFCPAGTNPGTDGVNEVLTPWGGVEPCNLLLPVGTGQNQLDLVFPSFAPPELVEKMTAKNGIAGRKYPAHF